MWATDGTGGGPKNVAPGQGGLTGRRKRRLGESGFGRGTKTGQSEGGSTDRFGLIYLVRHSRNR